MVFYSQLQFNLSSVIVVCFCDISVLIIVAVSFAGLAICLTIIFCGLVCLKR